MAGLQFGTPERFEPGATTSIDPELQRKQQEQDLRNTAVLAGASAPQDVGYTEKVYERAKGGVMGGISTELAPIVQIADAPLVSAGLDKPLKKFILDPAEVYTEHKKEQYTAESVIGEIGLLMAEGLGHMAVTLPIDGAIGGIIIGAMFAAGAPVTVAGAGLTYAGYLALTKLAPWALGMAYRQWLTETSKRGKDWKDIPLDIVKSMDDFATGMVTGKLMTVIPHVTGKAPVYKTTSEFATYTEKGISDIQGWAASKPAAGVAKDVLGNTIFRDTGKLAGKQVVQNFLGWGAFGASQVGWQQVEGAADDIANGREVQIIPRKQYVMGIAESWGYSLAFIGSAGMTQAYRGAQGSFLAGKLARADKLAKAGRYDPALIRDIATSKDTPTEVAKAARELEGEVIAELSLRGNLENTITDEPVKLTPEDVWHNLATPEARGPHETTEAVLRQMSEEAHNEFLSRPPKDELANEPDWTKVVPELADPPTPLQNNASGATETSIEAVNRLVSERKNKKQIYRVDTRRGFKVTPTGHDVMNADLVPDKGIIYIQRGAGKDGTHVVRSKGELVSAAHEARAAKSLDDHLVSIEKREGPKDAEAMKQIASIREAAEKKRSDETVVERWVYDPDARKVSLAKEGELEDPNTVIVSVFGDDKKTTVAREPRNGRSVERLKDPMLLRDAQEAVKSQHWLAARQQTEADLLARKEAFALLPANIKFEEAEREMEEAERGELYVRPRAVELKLGARVKARDLAGNQNWGNVTEISEPAPFTKEQLYKISFEGQDGKVTTPHEWYNSQELKLLRKVTPFALPEDARITHRKVFADGNQQVLIEVRDPKSGEFLPVDKWLTEHEAKLLLKEKTGKAGFLNTLTKGLLTREQIRRMAVQYYQISEGMRPTDPAALAVFSAFSKPLTTAETIEFLREVTEIAPEVMGQRQPESVALTEAKAKRMSTHLAWFRDIHASYKNSAAKMTAARMTKEASAMRLAQLAHRATDPAATAADKVLFEEWVGVDAEMGWYTEDMKSELGSGLRSLQNDALAHDLMNATTLKDVSNVMKKHQKGNPRMAAWVEMYRGGLFGNLETHQSNLGLNIVNAGMRTILNFYEVGVGYRNYFSGKDRKLASEAIAEAYGKLRSQRDMAMFIFGQWKTAYDAYHVARKGAEARTDAETAEVLVEAQDPASRIQALLFAERKINTTSMDPYGSKFEDVPPGAWNEKAIWGHLDPAKTTLAKATRDVWDGMGIAFRSTLTLLGQEDVIGKYVGYRGKIAGIAVREANRLGLTGIDRESYVAGFEKSHKLLLEENLHPLTNEQKIFAEAYIGNGDFHREAMTEAREATFTGSVDGGSPTQDMTLAFVKFHRKLALLQITIPTLKTPLEIMSQVVQMTPGMHKLSLKMKQDFESGDPRRVDQAWAKLAFGSTLYSLGMYLYFEGHITPMPDKDMRGVRDSAIASDSIVFMGKTYSMQQLGNIGVFFRLAASLGYALHNTIGLTEDGINLFEKSEDGTATYKLSPEEVQMVRDIPILGSRIGTGGQHWSFDQAASYMMLAMSQLFGDQMFMGGLKTLLDGIWGDRGTKPLAKVAQRVAVNLTTPFSGQLRYFNKKTDPWLRETENIIDAYKVLWAPQGAPNYKGVRGLDWLASPAKLKHDIFGKPVPQLTKFLGTMATHDVSLSPVRQEIVRLELPVQEMIDDEYRGIKLTEEQQQKWNKYVEDLLTEDKLNAVIKSEMYRNASDVQGSVANGTKGGEIMKHLRAARRRAFGKLNRDYNGELGKRAVVHKRGMRRSEIDRSKGGYNALQENIRGGTNASDPFAEPEEPKTQPFQFE